MDGLFNIAVAQFGKLDSAGQVSAWEDGTRLSASLARSLQTEFASSPNLSGVQVRAQDVGLVQGQTPGARDDAARRIANNLHADIVIYGYLEQQGDTTVFVPRFYINNRRDISGQQAVSVLNGAEELVGTNQLGSPVPTSESLGGALVVNDTLKSRLDALTYFTEGLAYLVAHQAGKAIDWFGRAADPTVWADEQGKEVIYLFLGTAYMQRNQPGDLDLARQAYQKSHDLNPHYARAYIGLGNVSYEKYRRDQADRTNLDQAAAFYQNALDANDQTLTLLIEAKVYFSLGNIHNAQAQTGQPQLFSQAEGELKQVITAYQKNEQDPDLKALAAYAYLGLGIARERGAQDYAGAANYYQACLAIVGDNLQVQQLAEAQLEIVRKQLGSPTPP